MEKKSFFGVIFVASCIFFSGQGAPKSTAVLLSLHAAYSVLRAMSCASMYVVLGSWVVEFFRTKLLLVHFVGNNTLFAKETNGVLLIRNADS